MHPGTRSRRSLFTTAETSSLGAGSVVIGKSRGWRRFLAFSGPAYLVSVGYMDPGNWATDIEGGARFGYQLLWVLVISNLMAILLQTLSARLGIATGRDLAQSCRNHYPKPINLALWVLCEAAIAACDLAEVLGSAIAIKLLFGIPLLWGVLITALDALLILSLSGYGIRLLERVVLGMVVLIGGCFAVQILLAHPDFAAIAGGLTPRLTGESLYIAIGMLGATVMPHNLYLHSALVQTREIGESDESKRDASHFNFLDSAIALSAALFVNVGILVLASAVFHSRGIAVTEIEQAHQLLSPLLGTGLASILFAVALLASGQSSTFTGTLAGQIVMEGFLSLRMRPWMRLLLTRMVAIVPAVAVIAIVGEQGTYPLLIFSQVLLSLQLPFAIIPLVHFTGDSERMGALASPKWLRTLAWLTAALVVGLNIWLAARTLSGMWGVLIAAPLGALLFYIVLEPWLRRRPIAPSVVVPEAPVDVVPEIASYKTILVPLDHSELDRVALQHALAMAKMHGARLILMHVEEGVASRVYGEMAESAEEREGSQYMRRIQESLAHESIASEIVTAYSGRPGDEIVRFAKHCKADLVVMGAHGHKGLKDIVFGSTINAVRHNLTVPLFIARKSD